MKLIDLFVRRPVVAIVVNLVVLLIGLRAITDLPIQQFPRIESSSVIVTTVYIGAPADVVRGFITTPVERAVSSISGVEYVESSSVAGVSTVTVRLKLNHPSTVALAEVGNRLDQIRNELPSEAEPPTVYVQRADRPYATFYVAVTADSLDQARLTDYLTREVQPRLTTIPGVQSIGLEGARPQAMRIWLDSERMAAFGLGAEEVQGALTRNNFIAAVGQAKGKEVQVNLLTDTDLKTPAEFEQLIVRERDGAIIRLSDIARIELGSEEATMSVGMGERDAIYLSVWPLPGSNEITVAHALRKELDAIRPTLPGGVQMEMAFDATLYMEDALQEIAKTLTETVLIVGLVVYLFLGSARTALVPLVAIPVSLIGAMGAMLALGFSLNLLTLLAIVLSVGLVVDDAIVVVENVNRLMREGKGRIQAALLSARQLFSPIIAMTITLAAVYAPIGFLSGLTGVLFKEFAFTLAIAVVMSGVVAVTLSPIMSAWVAPRGGQEGRMTQIVGRVFDRVRDGYERALTAALTNRPQVLVSGVFILLLAFPLYMFSGKELAPIEDQGMVTMIITSAPDATLSYTTEQVRDVVSLAKSLPDSRETWQIVFPSNGFGGVDLKNWRERDRSAMEMLPDYFGAFSGIAGVQVFPVLFPSLPGAGNFDVELVIKGNATPEQMSGYAQQMVQAAFQSGKFMFADSDMKVDMPEVKLMVDRERVADLGLDLADVGRQLATLLAGNYVNRFNYEGRAYKVIPQIGQSSRATADQLLDLKIRTPDGGQVSLASLVTLETKAAPRSLTRFQQSDSFRVFGGVIPGVTKADGLATMEQIAAQVLPAGFSFDYAGESRQIKQEGNTLLGTLGFAIILIYLVLAAQFQSFRDPMVVLLGSVPLALSGALVFPFLGATTINIYSQVGLITLVGLIAKNGILIVEFANHLQEEGRTKLEAVREASLTRLRPVLMTTAATVIGHFPLVLVEGPGAESRNSIGIVLVTGMAIGTFFTLFVLPCVYMLIAATHRKVEEVDIDAPSDAPSAPSAAPGSPVNMAAE